MFQEQLNNVILGGFICGIIFSIIFSIVLIVSKKEFNPLILGCSIGLCFICLPMIFFAAYEGLSEHIHKENGNPLVQLVQVDRVFSNASSYSDYSGISNIKNSFNVPDDWYDEKGRLAENIDIEILPNNQAQISFYDLSDELCKRILRKGRMYNGSILNENSCKKRGEVSVVFGNKSE